jgi:RND family efflux transporter MFP subunit
MLRTTTLQSVVVLALLWPMQAAFAAPLATEPALEAATRGRSSYDGVVEAVRHTVIAAQVPGAVVELAVKVGDQVKAGQLLMRIDARTADQSAAAVDAQVQAARAQLDVATREYERQKQLFAKKYISQAALDRAEAEVRATRAQANAQAAQAGAARTQTGLHVVRAPYAGIVAEVPVALGDMAMPGRPLLTMYDPVLLRVTASVPQSALSGQAAGAATPEGVRVELPGQVGAHATPTRVQVLPTVDPATHTVQVRAELPVSAGVRPGMFARLWLPGAASAGEGARITVPLRAIVRRAEMTGLYVLAADGKPQLRQVRLGRAEGERVEVLSGVAAGENVVTEPQAAASAR